MRHNLIFGQTMGEVFLFLVKTHSLFWLSLVVCQKLCRSKRSYAFFGVCVASVAHTFYFLEESKLKKLLSIMFGVVILLTITACANNEGISNIDGVNSQESAIEHTGEKINGEITGASNFSEGLAFVCVNGNKEKTYCINTEGYVVFELDFRAVNAMGKIESRFVNGLAKVGEGLCDTKGRITMPADVGATAFCDIALDGGYIIAERVTSDFESSKKELGVLNTSFEWVINPSEEIYNATGGISMIPNSTQCFYYDDYFYFEDTNKYLNLKTGEIENKIDVFPSERWVNSDKNFYDYYNTEMLSLESNKTINMPSGSDFKNGKAPVRFINQETNKYYFTVINEKGEFLFEPIETIAFQNFVFDGENILALDQSINPKKIVSYNINGQLLGQIETETIAKNNSFSCYVNDGVVLLNAGRNSNYTCYYYNTDFTPLF